MDTLETWSILTHRVKRSSKGVSGGSYLTTAEICTIHAL